MDCGRWIAADGLRQMDCGKQKTSTGNAKKSKFEFRLILLSLADYDCIYHLYKSFNLMPNSDKGIADESEEQNGMECICCSSSKLGVNYYFAKCQHTGICRRCGEKRMLECLRNRQIPQCLYPDCGAAMSTEPGSLYEYFSVSNQQKWRKEGQKLSQPAKPIKLPSCKKPNCKGLITKGKCPQCSTAYCQRCKQFDHDISKPCQQKADILFQGVKSCPQCNVPFIREAGCLHINCPECKFEFCEECLEKWDDSHHRIHGAKGICSAFWGYLWECCCKSTVYRSQA